jgi:hypothetical protein
MEIAMLRALEVGLVGGGGIRRLAVIGLLAVGGALAPLVIRAKRKAAQKTEAVEVARLEIGGVTYGAVYEDGRLVGLLESVQRL